NGFLWALREACNASKHKIIAPIAVNVTGVHIIEFRSSGGGKIPQMVWDNRTNEMVLFIIPKDSHIKYNVGIPFNVGFYDVEFVRMEPIIEVLNEMVGIVSGIIDGFEAEAIRLNIFSGRSDLK